MGFGVRLLKFEISPCQVGPVTFGELLNLSALIFLTYRMGM